MREVAAHMLLPELAVRLASPNLHCGVVYGMDTAATPTFQSGSPN
jgi:hypothetical protein